MNPLATALLILGYGLALPIATKLPDVVGHQHRLALWGHQLGILIAALGWVVRGQILIALAHVIWMVIASIWFGVAPGAARVRSKVGRRDKARRRRA